MAETENVTTDLEFKWGKMGGVGKKKKIQFYESFTYDCVEYSLYDYVYMHKEGEPEPYIGKLVRIWVNADKTKRVRVQWFFRPSEILRWLGDEMSQENEIFLASGEGFGCSNVNDLEAIVGRCNVVCTSKDNRNRQPSEEELKMADFIFYRTFDVGLCAIFDKMEDKVGEIEVKFVFNKIESENRIGIPKLVFDSKVEINYSIVCNGEQHSLQYVSDVKESSEAYREPNQSIATKDTKGPLITCEPVSVPVVKPTFESGVNYSTLATSRVSQASGAMKDVVYKVPINKLKAKEKLEFDKGLDSLDDICVKKTRLDGDNHINRVQKFDIQDIEKKTIVTTIDEYNKDPHKQVEVVKSPKLLEDLEDKPSKLAKAGVNFNACQTIDLVTSNINYEKRSNSRPLASTLGLTSPTKTDNLDEKIMKAFGVEFPLANPLELKDKEAGGNVFEVDEILVVTSCMNPRLLKNTSGSKALDVRMRKSSICGLSVVSEAQDKDKESDKSKIFEGGLQPGDGSYMDPCGLISTRVETLDKRTRKSSSSRLPGAVCTSKAQDKNREGGQGKVFEVARRPNDGNNKWYKTLWEDKLKSLYEQGRLVLLSNLDPAYTTEEVEDIMWHAFEEISSVKMVPHTRISKPHSGQAIVIFRSRKASEMVVRKLYEGCLMLPNGRPLVGRTEPRPELSEKIPMYFGHLVLDDQNLQRVMKGAVSTSHSSQPNSIEYDVALEWCLQQSRADFCWEKLYKQQEQELNLLKAKLRSK